MGLRLLPWLSSFCRNQIFRVAKHAVSTSWSRSPTSPWELLLQYCLTCKSSGQFLPLVFLYFFTCFSHIHHSLLPRENSFLGFPVLPLFCIFVLWLPWTHCNHLGILLNYSVFSWWRFSGPSSLFFALDIWTLGDFICFCGFRSFCHWSLKLKFQLRPLSRSRSKWYFLLDV